MFLYYGGHHDSDRTAVLVWSPRLKLLYCKYHQFMYTLPNKRFRSFLPSFLHLSFKVHPSAPYVMTGHMSAFTNFILSSFRIPLSFQIVSSSMVAFLALPILALMSSEQLPVLVLMVPRYLKEFTLAIVSPSMSIDTFALSSPTIYHQFGFSCIQL